MSCCGNVQSSNIPQYSVEAPVSIKPKPPTALEIIQSIKVKREPNVSGQDKKGN